MAEGWEQLKLHPPNTRTPLRSLSGGGGRDGEGIILILQNAQQLIKSRSPGFGVLLHVNGGGKSPARPRGRRAGAPARVNEVGRSLSEPRANKPPATGPPRPRGRLRPRGEVLQINLIE